MIKYDVGIYGLWYGNNYGSIITYYALAKVMEKLGKTYAMIRNPLGRNIDIDSLERSHPLRFAKERYNITKLRPLNDLGELNEHFNAFLIGSDQMWNYHLSRPYKQSYFLDFASDDKIKVAYATSFGKNTYIGPPEEKIITEKNLKRFDAISVRDDFSKRICEEDFGVHADAVLDPVFLCPVEKYDELIAEADTFSMDEEYIFAYILDPNPAIGESICKIADESGKKVVVVFNQSGDKIRFRDALQISHDNVMFIPDPTVKEWLYLFKNAKFVVTDSFHGSCFSIIFRRPFIVMRNNGRGGGRFPYLLGNFGLLDRMVESPEDIAEKFLQVGIENNIDYDKVFDIISHEQADSLLWLKKALSTRAFMDNSVMKIAENRTCTGCSACEGICPKNAIKMEENNEGFLYPEVDTGKCVGCGLCLKKCISENPVYKNVPKPVCYAVNANDDVRKISSSGGMFTIAAENILDKGGYVCGAAYRDDFTVEHILINDKSELYKLRGSKYMQSHIGNVYKDIKQLLDDDKTVLFTGMPCQVAGLYSYLGKEYDKLYTIDLLCHGISSSKVFEKYHNDVLENKQLERLEFKEKEPWGWHAGINAYFADGTKYSKPLENDPYFIAYLKSISKNTTCGVCKANHLPRQGDLTMGDFWGIAKHDTEVYDGKGTSVVLTNNPKGEALFNELKPSMQKWKEEPLNVAIKGNGIIQAPYKLNKNRQAFFDNFDKLDFKSLTMGCLHNRLYYAQKRQLKNLSEKDMELYYLARTAAERSRGRMIVTWAKSHEFERILKEYFGIEVAFAVAMGKENINNRTVFAHSMLQGKSSRYYVVAISPGYKESFCNTMNEYGYNEIADVIFRNHKPVIVDNFNLASGRYEDAYGNTIEGYSGRIGRIIFRGCNNHIVLGDKIVHSENLTFDLHSNASIEIGNECQINGQMRIISVGANGSSEIRILEKCRFANVLMRLYTHERRSSVVINDSCTFGINLEIHANVGKKLIIGRDCMFSHNVGLWAGDGHAVFDVNTGENVNSDYDSLPDYKNKLVIGDHVWVSRGAFIMHGTEIGSGSIVGAMSVVKRRFPNNCTIAGNPASMVKTDVAWSRDMIGTDMHRQCGSEDYVRKTVLPDSTEKRKVLILGGTGRMSTELTKLCIARNDDVTISVRGKHKINDDISSVRVLKFDRLNEAETRKNLEGKFYDVVFDCSGYVPQSVDWVLSSVKTDRYVYVSSFGVYAHYHRGFDLHEDDLAVSGKNNYAAEIAVDEKAWYQRGKFNSELLIANKYPDINYAIVRIPFVITYDDDFEDASSGRILKYVSAVVNNHPINSMNLDRRFNFVDNKDESEFLYFLSENNFKGVVNFASDGYITMNEVIEYVQNKTGKKAVLDENAELLPFSAHPEVTMNLDRCKSLNYNPVKLDSWFYKKNRQLY